MANDLELLQCEVSFHYYKDERGERMNVEMLPVFQWGKDFNSGKTPTMKMYLPKSWAQEMVNYVSPLEIMPKHTYFLMRVPTDEPPKDPEARDEN